MYEGQIKFSKCYTEGTFLVAMERVGEEVDDAEFKCVMKCNGLGIFVTCAVIIERFFSCGFIEC